MRNGFLILFLLCCVPCYSQQYSNPVMRYDWPDPTVWMVDNCFYSLATGVGVYLRKSTDLVNWDGTPYRAQTQADISVAQSIGTHFWAPDMVRLGDHWNLYVSLYNSAWDSGIGLFRSESPTGPFSWVGLITHSKQTAIKDTIDPDVVEDPETGKIWLFFGSTGKVYRVELNNDGTALANNAEYTHVAGLDIKTNPDRSKVFEGSYLYKRGNWWYLFASAGLYSDYTYRIVVGRSISLTGVFLDREGRKMTEGFATELMSSQRGDDFFGPGHNGEIITDSTGQDYVLYHCHNKLVNGSTGSRYLMMQRLFWDEEGWPYVQDGVPAKTDITPVFN